MLGGRSHLEVSSLIYLAAEPQVELQLGLWTRTAKPNLFL